MLKANKVQAVALQLQEGGQAVLVQDGPDWNGLRKFKCIAPPQCDKQIVIATKDDNGSPMAAAFGALFDLGENERWVIVMCSPYLAALLKH
jgi:hypothetical protein